MSLKHLLYSPILVNYGIWLGCFSLINMARYSGREGKNWVEVSSKALCAWLWINQDAFPSNHIINFQSPTVRYEEEHRNIGKGLLRLVVLTYVNKKASYLTARENMIRPPYISGFMTGVWKVFTPEKSDWVQWDYSTSDLWARGFEDASCPFQSLAFCLHTYALSFDHYIWFTH